MENLISEIKAIKSSSNLHYQISNLWDDKDHSKYKEGMLLIREYRRAVRWLRMCNIKIDLDVE